MLDLVGNPEVRFSRVASPIVYHSEGYIYKILSYVQMTTKILHVYCKDNIDDINIT